ncbi:MAG: aryl-sulfate sulfotransferase [Planctomycetota bacterium]|jgi:hypothetical protein
MHRSTALRDSLILSLALASCSGGDDRYGSSVPEPSRTGLASSNAYQGFLLVTPLKSKDVFLVDMQGEVVHRWETEWEPGNSVYLTDRGTIYRCMRIEEDVDFGGGGIGGGIQEIAADGTVLWEYRMADGERHHHHDIEVLPNGNLLLIAWEKYTKQEAIARGRDPELLRGEEFWPGAIYEIRPSGDDHAEIVWEWHTWDHLIQDFDPDAMGFGDVAASPHLVDINGDRDPELMSVEQMDAQMDQLAAMGYAGGDDDDDTHPTAAATTPPAMAEAEAGDEDKKPPTAKELRRAKFRDADWMHTNAIDYNPKLDQIAISVRRFDEIWVIDHSTTTAEAATGSGGRSGRGGDLLYRWGNPAAYGMGSLEDRILVGQHDVQWIEEGMPGAGGLMVFNNGKDRPDGEWSSIEEWWPPMDKDGNYLRDAGEPFGPSASSWTYLAPEPTDFFSSFISGVQRLPNGNTLICSGADGLVFEVNADDRIVWEWKCDLVPEKVKEEGDKSPVQANSLFRVTRIPADHPGIVALRRNGARIPALPPVD